MKTRTKKLFLIALIPLSVFFGLGAFRIWYGLKYGHQHCIKQFGNATRAYEADHQDQLPFSTNGFGDALLLLAKEDTNYINCLCGPDDDGHIFRDAIKNNAIVFEDQCSRVYVQGLSETNDLQICILFDRNSCRGGDHFRSPLGHRVRELSLLDGSMQVIPDEDWPEFSRKQVELLVAAGFSRTNALHFYPAGK
jgi:hypothetical protein